MNLEANQLDPLVKDLPKQYEMLGKIRTGGMGAIYKAQNQFTKQIYAIKVLRQEGAHDPLTRQRFIAEAKAAGSLRHPNICQVFDFGVTESETLYLVLEWIDGISLDEKVSRSGPLADNEAVSVFIQICSALALAHANGIIHRDLKPENIMLTRDKDNGASLARLIDFGIAKVVSAQGESKISEEGLTQNGTVVGTPAFMSPEQARAKHADFRSDVYCFGCVMYFALSGKPPFNGDNYLDVLYQHVKEPPPPLDPKLKVSAQTDLIMRKCLEKKPEDRYQSMDELIADFKKVSQGVNIKRQPLAQEREKVKSRLLWWLQAVAVFIAVFLFSIWMQNLASPSEKAPAKTGSAHPTSTGQNHKTPH